VGLLGYDGGPCTGEAMAGWAARMKKKKKAS
jgi:hypothetical protein